MHLSPVWHGLPAPPPLAQKLPTPLHFQAHIEHLLYGFLEAVEIVVDKSCVSKTSVISLRQESRSTHS